jgi:hypothetical protein
MIEKIKKMIRNRKIAKLQQMDDTPIIIPSLAMFIEAFKDNVRKESAASTKPIEQYNVNKLIGEFQNISVAALVDTLIQVGYKRKKK